MFRLIGFHHAGGNAAALAPLRRELGTELEFQAIELPGHGTRFREPLQAQRSQLVKQLCAELAPRTDRPYALFGHSLGAILAYETAQALIASGARAPSMLLVAAAPGPSKWPARVRGPGLSDADLKMELQRRGGTPPELFEHPDLVELFMPVVRADFLLCDEPSPSGWPALPCPVHVHAGRQDDIEPARLVAWRTATQAEFTLSWYEGDHFFPRSHARALSAAILQRVAAL